jgi:tRNA threonylcarbamoyladenosine biosynthesis protein TsaB
VNILAIDTAAAILSAALETEKGAWFFEADAGPRHSEMLMDVVDILMKKAGLQKNELEGLVCMKGPGSFTGLRIGFSTVKGLALSLGIPFASVPTLDCMAFPFSPWPGLVLPLIDAKQNRFFTALYRGGERLSGFMDAGLSHITEAAAKKLAATPPGQKQVLLTGPDAGLFYEKLNKNPPEGPASPPLPANSLFLDPVCRRGRARELLAIVKKLDILNNDQDEIFSGPEYLRKSDAETHLQSLT